MNRSAWTAAPARAGGRLLAGIGAALMIVGTVGPLTAGAVHDTGLFELDGNIIHDGLQTYDWGNLFNPNGTRAVTPDPVNGPLLATAFVNDSATPDTSYVSNSSKDGNDLPTWQCGSVNNPTAKDNILHSYAALVQVPAGAPDNAGHEVLYLALDREANTGSVEGAGFWLYQDPTVACANGQFSGLHKDGDLLIVSNFTNGGGTQQVQVFRWDHTVAGNLSQVASGGVCGTSTPDDACGIANEVGVLGADINGTIATPFLPGNTAAPLGAPAGDAGLLHDTFIEAGVDLTSLLPSGTTCFTNLLAETRSSPSVSAEIKDFAFMGLQTCVPPNMSTTATPGGTTVPGTAQHDVANVGAVVGRPAPTGTVQFALCTPSTAGFVPANGCTSGGTNIGSPVTIAGGQATGPAVDGGTTPNDLAEGTYCWSATYVPDANGSKNYVTKTLTAPAGECFTIARTQPTIATTGAVTGGKVGVASTSDVVTIFGPTGSPTNADSVTFSLWGPVSGVPGATSCQSPTPLVTTSVRSGSQITQSGPNWTVTSASFVPQHAGTYIWTADFSGDSVNAPVSEPCNGTGETVLVPKATPSITTSASPTVMEVNTTTTAGDMATFNNGWFPTTPSPAEQVSFQLLAPDCTTVKASGTGNITVSGGVATASFSTSFTPTATGTYHWVASFAGDADNAGFTTTCGDANEQLHVVDANITITPLVSTNEVGHAHVFTVTVTAIPAGATPVSFATPVVSVVPAPGSLLVSALSGTGNTRTFTITINSTAPGAYSIQASDQVTMGGVTVTRTTGDAHAGDSASAVKNFVDATIALSPLSAHDPIGDHHVITATVQINTGSGWAAAPNGTTVNFNLNNSGGASATFVGSANCTTAGGTCTVTITSPTTGTTTVGATTTVTITVGGASAMLTRTTDDGVSGDSAHATKIWDPLTPGVHTTPSSAVLVLGNGPVGDVAHVTGGSFPGATGGAGNGQTIFHLFGPFTAPPTVASCTAPTEQLAALATVSADPGGTATLATYSYTSTFTPTQVGWYQWVADYLGNANNNAVNGACGDTSEEFVVVDAYIFLTPATAVNPVNAAHTITAHVFEFDGTGPVYTPGVGVPVTFSVAGVATPASGACTTGAAGTCTFVINSSAAGQSQIMASIAPVIRGQVVNRVTGDNISLDGAPVTKTYVDARVLLTPQTATDTVGDIHVLTAHVDFNNGSGGGFVSAPAGTPITFAIDPSSTTGTFTTPSTCTTIGTTGSCTASITSTLPGVTIVTAGGSFNVCTVAAACATVTRVTGDSLSGDSPAATKTWVKAQPAIATTPSAGGTTGVVLSDVATVTGGLNPTGTVTFTLFGPTDTTCSGTPIFTSTVPLTAGQATSAGFTTVASSGVGSYNWVATYNGDPSNLTAVSSCGSETVAVAAGAVQAITSIPVPVTGSWTPLIGLGAALFAIGIVILALERRRRLAVVRIPRKRDRF